MSGFRGFKNFRTGPRPKIAGRSFASQLEAGLFLMLQDMEQTGEVKDVRCQPHVFLTDARIEMIPDFSVHDLRRQELIYHEAKGFETDVWRIKRRLWVHYGPAPLWVWKGRGTALKLVEEIVPKGYTKHTQGKTNDTAS